MRGFSQSRIGRITRAVFSVRPRLVEAPKIRVIQRITGSQYLKNRPDITAKNSRATAKASRKNRKNRPLPDSALPAPCGKQTLISGYSGPVSRTDATGTIGRDGRRQQCGWARPSQAGSRLIRLLPPKCNDLRQVPLCPPPRKTC